MEIINDVVIDPRVLRGLIEMIKDGALVWVFGSYQEVNRCVCNKISDLEKRLAHKGFSSYHWKWVIVIRRDGIKLHPDLKNVTGIVEWVYRDGGNCTNYSGNRGHH